jgi:thiaminase/transcriptional activator TenA
VITTTTETFSAELWHDTRHIRAGIDQLPFLAALEDGSLERHRFAYYMAQDAAYLAKYAVALEAAAGLAHIAASPADAEFWAASAIGAVAVERELHAAHVADFDAVTASPTCTAYTCYLLSLVAGGGSYESLVAGLLPCFWIYEDVGRRLLERVGTNLADHPYADWIGTYADPEFAVSTARARGIFDALAAAATPAVRAEMQQAFTTASRYEWMFWDAAWRMESWPI